MAPKRQLKHMNSPFFAPSTPRKLVTVSTPGGTSRMVKKESTEAKEHKSSVMGATSNLVNAVIGAGIVGLPFAMKEAGLVAGFLLVILCAILTEKSLRVLVNTAKHVDVPSYETLFESAYGSFGFYFISINMLIMAYGGCLSYMTIIKDTLPVLMGVEAGNKGMERAILTVSTLLIILPISMQRDMADLAKTSRVSVLFQCLTVLVVVIFSPVTASLDAHGGLEAVISTSVVKSSTIFIGLGVLSFAFVCQHSAFIVAGSLENPTKERWGKATFRALSLCVVLEASCGIFGYLAFLDATEGNILNNFLSLGEQSSETLTKAANIARGLLCTTMFFVYPMDSFVCRHVLVVLFFRGRRAHEGDDAAVLSRRDRRVAMTLVIYLSVLIPALMVDNVGSVLAITGTIAGSCLSYVGPGMIYLAVYGEDFLKLVERKFGEELLDDDEIQMINESGGGKDVESAQLLANQQTETKSTPNTTIETGPSSPLKNFLNKIVYYVFLFPFWCFIARLGKKKLKLFLEKEALKSPHINRLGKLAPPSSRGIRRARGRSFDGAEDNGNSNNAPPKTFQQLPQAELAQPSQQVPPGPKMLSYGAIPGGNKAIGAALIAKRQSSERLDRSASTSGDDPTDIDLPPTWYDFIVAIFFIVFGVVALCAGLVSIMMTE